MGLDQNYFGITEMLEEGLILNIENNYQHFITNEDDVSYLSEEIKDCILHLNKFENGIGIIRTSKTSEAVELKNQLNFVNKDFETIIIGCKDGCDYEIKDGLRILPRMIKNQNKRVIVLVIHALTAGKDLKSLKDHVRFVIETRKTQLANCAQGLPGRVCGYHSNRDIKIYANQRILEYFSHFEINPDVMYDNEWMSGLRLDEKVRTLTTHTRLKVEHKEGYFTDIVSAFELDHDDIISNKGKEFLSFLTNEQYETLIKLFKPSVYNDGEYVRGIHNENFHLKVASRYKKNIHVYSYLEKDKGDNFRSIFSPRKGVWKHGILVANYPVGHPNNNSNFCGIKVLNLGKQTGWNLYHQRLTILNIIKKKVNHGLKKIFKFLKHFIIFYTLYEHIIRMREPKLKFLRQNTIYTFIQNKMGGPKELLEKINSEISEIDPNQQIGSRTLQKQIKDLKDNRGWPIIKNSGVFEFEKNFDEYVIYDDEMQKINEAFLILQRFIGKDGFEWLDTLDEYSFDIDLVNKIIQYEESNTGMSSYFKTFKNAIINKHVLTVKRKILRNGLDIELDIEFHPHFLKIYNNKWYVFGLKRELNESNLREVSNYVIPIDKYISLDGIKSLENMKSLTLITPRFLMMIIFLTSLA